MNVVLPVPPLANRHTSLTLLICEVICARAFACAQVSAQ